MANTVELYEKLTPKQKALFDELEEAGFSISLYEDADGISAELETDTDAGVNMLISFVPFTLAEFRSYVDDFEVDEQVLFHCGMESYRKAFTVRESLEDFEEFASFLHTLVATLEARLVHVQDAAGSLSSILGPDYIEPETDQYGWLTDAALIDLRKQIVLHSIRYRDYENTYGLDSHEVLEFFDGYVDYLGELMSEDGHTDEEFFDILKEYDTDENLISWYGMFTENPFTIDWTLYEDYSGDEE